MKSTESLTPRKPGTAPRAAGGARASGTARPAPSAARLTRPDERHAPPAPVPVAVVNRAQFESLVRSIPVLSVRGVATPPTGKTKHRLRHVSATLAKKLTALLPAPPDSITGPLPPLRYDSLTPFVRGRKGEVDLVYLSEPGRGRHSAVKSPTVRVVIAVAYRALGHGRSATLQELADELVARRVGYPTTAAGLARLVKACNRVLVAVRFPILIELAQPGVLDWMHYVLPDDET